MMHLYVRSKKINVNMRLNHRRVVNKCSHSDAKIPNFPIFFHIYLCIHHTFLIVLCNCDDAVVSQQGYGVEPWVSVEFAFALSMSALFSHEM